MKIVILWVVVISMTIAGHFMLDVPLAEDFMDFIKHATGSILVLFAGMVLAYYDIYK